MVEELMVNLFKLFVVSARLLFLFVLFLTIIGGNEQIRKRFLLWAGIMLVGGIGTVMLYVIASRPEILLAWV